MVIMFQSRLLKATLNHLQFVNGLCNIAKCEHAPRRKLIYPMNKGQIKVLMDIFGLRYRIAYEISRTHANLRTIDQALLYKAAGVLHRFGITRYDLIERPQLLSISPVTLENHAMLLEEGGFTSIRPNHLLSFIVMMRKRVKLLKLYSCIPDDVEVHNNFFTHLKDPPPPFDFPNSDDSDFMTLYMAALSHYLRWKLEISEKELERLVTVYPRLRYRSFRLMESSMNILEKELGFTKDKIRRHAYLIHTNPRYVLDILETFKTVGGMDVKTLLQRVPKIIEMPVNNLIKIEQYLQDFGIPEKAVRRCPEVYTLSCETVNERLHILHTKPEFMGLVSNPRVLRLVPHLRRACSRLDYFEKIKFRCASLNLLLCSKPLFEKFLRGGSERTVGNEIVIYLANELELDKRETRKLLHRHPFWCDIPLITAVETMNLLRDKGFSKEQIVSNIQILLYSRIQVKRHLNDLPYHPEVDKELERQKELGNEMEFSRQQQLALCLYFIERDHHFSGDGVWFENPLFSTTDDVAA